MVNFAWALPIRLHHKIVASILARYTIRYGISPCNMDVERVDLRRRRRERERQIATRLLAAWLYVLHSCRKCAVRRSQDSLVSLA